MGIELARELADDRALALPRDRGAAGGSRAQDRTDPLIREGRPEQVTREREYGAGGPLQPPSVHEAPPVRRGRPPKRFTARLRAYKGLGDPAP